MNKTYFPAANSGKGFFSRFSGIAEGVKPRYTYVLKGGPGVGKSTLMKKAAKRALEKGYDVEEFRCASDPSSLDAILVVQKGIVLLDGTAPHSIDPILPGVCDEIVNLGHFKRQAEFATFKGEIEGLFAENKRHYRTAYSMLAALYSLKREALETLSGEVSEKSVAELINSAPRGERRELFARSATPKGVVDYTGTFLPENTVTLSGLLGEATLFKAREMLCGKKCEIFYDFVLPECPRAIVFGDTAIAVCDGEEIPQRGRFFAEESEKLLAKACEELAGALSVHNKIEEIYREYVDYDRVNEEGEKLIKIMF